MIELKDLTPRRLQLALIALPMLLATIYLVFFAADRYVSVSTVALQQSGGNDLSAVPGAAMLLAGLSSPSREETLYLRQYVHSLGLLNQLEAKLGLRKHFESPSLDIPARLRHAASQEDFLDFYRSRVEVAMDEMSSTLTIRVQGFDPAFAQRLNRAVLDASEQFVNEMSHGLARERLRFSEEELARAGERLQRAKADVLAFQNKFGSLNPTIQAEASGALSAQLQAAITKAEAERRALLAFQTEKSFDVQALNAKIKAIQDQLEAERARATGNSASSERIGALALEFQGLKSKAEFVLDTYKVALLAVENARMDATRKIKSLVIIEPPTLAQSAEYPRRAYDLATLLVLCLLVYGVVRLVIATVREHQD